MTNIRHSLEMSTCDPLKYKIGNSILILSTFPYLFHQHFRNLAQKDLSRYRDTTVTVTFLSPLDVTKLLFSNYTWQHHHATKTNNKASNQFVKVESGKKQYSTNLRIWAWNSLHKGQHKSHRRGSFTKYHKHLKEIAIIVHTKSLPIRDALEHFWK